LEQDGERIRREEARLSDRVITAAGRVNRGQHIIAELREMRFQAKLSKSSLEAKGRNGKRSRKSNSEMAN
jgi:hypothetical protein